MEILLVVGHTRSRVVHSVKKEKVGMLVTRVTDRDVCLKLMFDFTIYDVVSLPTSR